MDPDNTQQPSAPSKQDRVRAQKLRMSCDACSGSKTKCDQNRPVCLRCQKVGLKCNYSVSQRKGKPPAASREAPAAEKSKSCELNGHGAGVESVFHLDHDSSVTDKALPLYDDITPVFWPELRLDMGDYSARDNSITSSSVFDQDLLSPGTSWTSKPTPMMPSNDAFNFDDGLYDGYMSSPAEFPIPMPTNPLPTPASGDVEPASQRYNCTKLASSSLDSLNSYSQTCRASTSPQAGSMECRIASFDQILIVNNSAVESAHQLLSCPCSFSQNSNLILFVIIDKILGLYRSSIRTDPSTRPTTSSSGAATDGLVRGTPITIGAYKLDARDEQRMRMHIVSNELRKAGALVERYADQYCSMSRQEREDTGIYPALTTLLRRRLKEAVRDIMSALRNS